MPDIRLIRTHRLTLAMARAAAQGVIDQLGAEYDVVSEWSGNALHFERGGVHGHLLVQDRQATLEITLEGLFKAFAPLIEEKAAARMDQVFREA